MPSLIKIIIIVCTAIFVLLLTFPEYESYLVVASMVFVGLITLLTAIPVLRVPELSPRSRAATLNMFILVLVMTVTFPILGTLTMYDYISFELSILFSIFLPGFLLGLNSFLHANDLSTVPETMRRKSGRWLWFYAASLHPEYFRIRGLMVCIIMAVSIIFIIFRMIKQ